MTLTSLHSQQISRNPHPSLGSPFPPTQPQMCGRLLTFTGTASLGRRLCTTINSNWKVPGPTCPAREDELGGPLGPALQGGWTLWTAMGAQGGHTYRAYNARASSPWEQGQGDVEGTAVLSRCCGPTDKGVRCSGPAWAGLTLRESAGPGGRDRSLPQPSSEGSRTFLSGGTGPWVLSVPRPWALSS